jgi:TonB family protein
VRNQSSPVCHPHPELDPPPAPHIGEHAPGEGERQAVATPLTEFPYYTIKELSKGPQVTSFVNVEFEGMDRYPGGGHITLTVWINEQGIVDSVTIERSNVPLKVEEHLRAAFLGAHFAPGEKDGNKVRSKMPVEVNYEPLNLVRPVTPLSTAKKR